MGRKLKEKEVAQIIGMSIFWLRSKRIKGGEGTIPYLKMGDGKKSAVLYDEDAVEAFMQSRVRRSTSE